MFSANFVRMVEATNELLRAIAQSELTPSDKVLLEQIDFEQDVKTCAQLLYEYYADRSRADRTPREVLYYHIGLLGGIVGISIQ